MIDDDSNKNHLTLYINTDLKKLAKTSGLNLSQEFEEWLRIRLNQVNIDKPTVDIDLEIAKYRSEIQKLQSQAELNKQFKDKEQEEVMVLDGIINNERDTTKAEHPERSWDDIAMERTHGVQFLFQKKFNKVLKPLEAKELFIKRLKERKIID